MQTPTPAPHSWTEYTGYLLATLVTIGNIVKWAVATYRERNKPAADLHESRARAARDFAEAEQLKVRATFDLGEEAVEVTRKLLRAQTIIFSLHEENDALKEENKRLRGEDQKRA